MEKIRALIIDDEKDAREVLAGLIELYISEIEIVGEADNIQDAKTLILSKRPDLIFLDISIGETSGFDLLDILNTVNFQIIFTTAHSEYALKAFRVNALDYLLKPIEPEHLVGAVEKVKKSQISLSHNQNDKPDSEARIKPKQLTINSADSITIIDLEEISYIHGEGNYSTFFMKDKSQVTASKNLGYFEKLLEAPDFFRCHQSFIVNLSQIKKIINKEGYLELKDGKKISFATKKKEALLQLLDR